MGCNYQNNVDNNVFLLGCSHCYFFPKHHLNYILVKIVVDFMFNGIADETMVNDGTRFVRFSATSFVIEFISCTTTI